VYAEWAKALKGDLTKLGEKIGAFYHPFRNGDTARLSDGREIEGYKGMMTLALSSINRPPIVRMVGGVREDITEEGEIYGGVILRASVEPDWYGEGKKPYPRKGLAFRLRTVVKIRDGQRFGRPPATVESDFSDLKEIEYQPGADALEGI
jgi:hypothetical protein